MNKKVRLNALRARSMAFLLSAVLLLSCLGGMAAASNAGYNDTGSHWAAEAIGTWSGYGILQGDGTNFYPDALLTRGEMAVILSRLLGLTEKAENTFGDLDSSWYTDAVLQCAAAGILQGDGAGIRPNDPITREEAVVLLGRMLGIPESATAAGFADGGSISSWARGYVNAMARLGYIHGFQNRFAPGDGMNRASLVTILDNAVTYINEPGTYSGDLKGIVIVACDGVAFHNATIAGGLIVTPGASGASVAFSNSLVGGTLQILGDNVSVTVGQGAAVTAVVSRGDGVTIGGSGSVGSVAIGGDNTAVNTFGTTVTVGAGADGATLNGNSAAPGTTTVTVAPPPGGGSSENETLKNARAALDTQIAAAEAITGDITKFLHDWRALTDTLDQAKTVRNTSNVAEIGAAAQALKEHIALADSCNAKLPPAETLNRDNFPSDDDYAALTAALDALDTLDPATAAKGDVEAALDALTAALKKAVVTAAQFTGTHIATNLDLNADGLNMEIQPVNGYRFTDTLTDELKTALIDGMTFDYAYGLIDQNTGAVHKDPAQKTNVTNLNYIINLDKSSPYFVRTQIGTDDSGNPVYQTDGDRYLGLGAAIQNELKAHLDCISVNDKGNIQIACDTEHFQSFSNLIRLVNGAMPFVFGDLPVSLTVPAEAVTQGVSLSTQNTFDILEVKSHVEVWEYISPDRAGEDGVVAVTGKTGSDASGDMSNEYDDAGNTYYIQRVPGDALTESDIRSGGVYGPNGTGNKLVKVCVDGRTGPTKWALTVKIDAKFLYNAFRTNVYVENYTLPATEQNPVDDSQWLKVEDKILGACTMPNMVGTSTYYLNTSGDHRFDATNPYEMWYFVELPKVDDFDITQDMHVYVNQLCGMTGGSGGGGANPQGTPFWGMDGRCSFTVTAD